MFFDVSWKQPFWPRVRSSISLCWTQKEAAAAEIAALRAELKKIEAGISSIPKQKLEDARKKDDEINK